MKQPSSKTKINARVRIRGFDTFDKNRRALEEARNELEGFTYRCRDYLEDTLFQEVSTDEQRAKLETLLSEVGDWLYGDGYTAPIAEVKLKLADLKALEGPITHRKSEKKQRQVEVETLEAILNQSEELIKVFTTRPPAPDADTLSEEEKLSFEMPELDVSPLTKGIEETKAWLKEIKAAQEAKADHEEPAFAIKDLYAKKEELNKITMALIKQQSMFDNIKRQADKEAKAKASSSSKSAASASASASSASAAAEAEATPNVLEEVVEEKVAEEKVAEKKDDGHDEL